MNCPGHVQIFKHGLKIYRDLPIRLAEFGVVHRYEPSGALHGLLRVRALHAGRRAHLLHRGAARRGVPEDQRPDPLGLCRFRLHRRHGQARDAARQARRHRRDVGSRRGRAAQRARAHRRRSPAGASRPAINPGEGAFYGPKFEYVLRDAIGRDWQCGTTQVDFNLPERFGAFYIDSRRRARSMPVMVHRAICGSMERFTRHLDRALCRALPAVARARCRRGRHHHLGRRRLRARRARRGAAPGPARRDATCATRRSTTRSASTRSPRCRCCWWSARRRRPSERLDPPARHQEADRDAARAALAMLADEAVPPDVRRLREAA